MAGPGTHLVLLTLLAIFCQVKSQSNNNPYGQNNNDPASQQASGNLYYMDSNSDCNGNIRNIYTAKATIKGHGGAAGLGRGPQSCTLKIKSEGQFLGQMLQINIVAMNIQDPNTVFHIYDGDAAQRSMGSFDFRSVDNPNKRTITTSGSAATFMLIRENVEQFNFDILVNIIPIRAGKDPSDNEFSAGDIFDKFPQEIIVGLIGGVYMGVLIIVAVVLFFYYMSLKGKDKKWETVQLDVMKTNSRFDTSRSQAWSTAPSVHTAPARGPDSYYSRGGPSGEPYPRKLPPPSEDADSDDTFQRKRLMNGERAEPPRYARNNQTFEEPEELDDPDHFEEKIMTSRVRTKKRGKARPPSYEEAVSSEEDSESDENSDDSSSEEDSIHKRSISSDDRSRRTGSTQSYTETESEEDDSDDDSRRSRGARGARGGRRHRQPKEKPRRRRRPPSSDGDGPSRSRQPHRPPVAGAMAAPPPAMYPAYPQGGQFVPVMAPGAQFQPMPMMQPAYPPPPQQERHPEPEGPRPTDPPVYSYLVRRGYTPMDARSAASQASVSGSQRSDPGQLEEPDVRLSSGVEYMRR